MHGTDRKRTNQLARYNKTEPMNHFLNCLNKILKDRRLLRRWLLCVFITTYNLILPAISVEKDNAENVSGLYLEDAEVIDNYQHPHAEPIPDDEVTDAPIVDIQEGSNKDEEESSVVYELAASGVYCKI